MAYNQDCLDDVNEHKHAGLEIRNLLRSTRHAMGERRIAWSTIVANIAIALIPIIGVVAIAGKLIHSHLNEGRALFFFQKSKTSCEEKIEAVTDLLPWEI